MNLWNDPSLKIPNATNSKTEFRQITQQNYQIITLYKKIHHFHIIWKKHSGMTESNNCLKAASLKTIQQWTENDH